MLKLINKWFLNRKSNKQKVIDCECEQHVVITRDHPKYCRRQNIVTDGQLSIPVSDVTHYLVQEFETQDELKREIKLLNRRLEEEQVKTNKYSASLVLIDEYKKRIDAQDVDIKEYEIKLKDEKSKHNKTISELEIYKVERVKKLENFNEAKRIAKEEFVKEALHKINLHKGPLSKAKAIELIEDVVCEGKQPVEEKNYDNHKRF